MGVGLTILSLERGLQIGVGREPEVIETMAHAGSSGHGASGGGGGLSSPTGESQTLFPPDEWRALQAEDRQAARNIVCLMTGVFITGLILYLGIAIWVA
jgi:hypothetical protein